MQVTDRADVEHRRGSPHGLSRFPPRTLDLVGAIYGIQRARISDSRHDINDVTAMCPSGSQAYHSKLKHGDGWKLCLYVCVR